MPIDPGFSATPLNELLQTQRDLIDRIRLTIGLDQATFAAEVAPAIEAYARFVHLLPATAADYFDRSGGLLALGLEVGFHSLQGTDAHIFSGQSSISTRRVLEPRWRHATFLAGLCCELHRPLTTLAVRDAGGDEWPAHRQPLHNWLNERQLDRYFVRWRPKAPEARGLALFALPHIVTSATLEYLDEGRSTIVPHLLASVAGLPVYREHNVLDSLVRRSLALVVERDLQAAADSFGAARPGTHLERDLVEALRFLAANEPSWRPNQDKSRVWYGSDGAFLGWPQCAADVRARMEMLGIAGAPKTSDAMLRLLLATGIAEPRSPAEPTWLLAPPGSKSPTVGLKLASPLLLWPDDGAEPARLDRPLGTAVASTPAANSPDKGGSQLSLLEPEAADECRGPTADPPSPSRGIDPAPAALPRLALQLPLRLNPVVRDGLVSIIETMNGPPRDVAACTVANGVFVPLAELERRGVHPALAIRALSDLRLLALGERVGSPAVSREFGGRTQLGLVLDPRCVSGLDLAAFVLTPTEMG